MSDVVLSQYYDIYIRGHKDNVMAQNNGNGNCSTVIAAVRYYRYYHIYPCGSNHNIMKIKM